MMMLVIIYHKTIINNSTTTIMYGSFVQLGGGGTLSATTPATGIVNATSVRNNLTSSDRWTNDNNYIDHSNNKSNNSLSGTGNTKSKTYDVPDRMSWVNGSEYSTKMCDYLDVAVTGFAKCGTSTMSAWLGDHPETVFPRGEAPDFYKNPFRKINRLHKLYMKYTNEQHQMQQPQPHQPKAILIGYKNPPDITYESVINFYATTCPETKHIVLVRHPV